MAFYWHGLDPFLPVEGRATANQYAVALCEWPSIFTEMLYVGFSFN